MKQKEPQHNSRCQSARVFLEKGKAQGVQIRHVLIIIPPHNDCAVTAKNYPKVLKIIFAKSSGNKENVMQSSAVLAAGPQQGKSQVGRLWLLRKVVAAPSDFLVP